MIAAVQSVTAVSQRVWNVGDTPNSSDFAALLVGVNGRVHALLSGEELSPLALDRVTLNHRERPNY